MTCLLSSRRVQLIGLRAKICPKWSYFCHRPNNRETGDTRFNSMFIMYNGWMFCNMNTLINRTKALLWSFTVNKIQVGYGTASKAATSQLTKSLAVSQMLTARQPSLVPWGWSAGHSVICLSADDISQHWPSWELYNPFKVRVSFGKAWNLSFQFSYPTRGEGGMNKYF